MDINQIRDRILVLLTKYPQVLIRYTYTELNTCECEECARDGIIGKYLTEFNKDIIDSIEEFDELSQLSDFCVTFIDGHTTTYVHTTTTSYDTKIGTYTGNGGTQTLIMLDDNGDILPPSSVVIRPRS